jgi:periplasmic copper chaperone A
MNKQLTGLIMAMTLAASAAAQVSVTDPWVRATVPQQKVSGAFMKLHSVRDARLIEVRSELAGTVEIHRMQMVGQVMKMHAVQGVDLPAGKAVALAPGAYHVMLMDLKQQLKEGEQVPLTLVVEGKDGKRKTIAVMAPVKQLGHVAPQAGQHMQHMAH